MNDRITLLSSAAVGRMPRSVAPERTHPLHDLDTACFRPTFGRAPFPVLPHVQEADEVGAWATPRTHRAVRLIGETRFQQDRPWRPDRERPPSGPGRSARWRECRRGG